MKIKTRNDEYVQATNGGADGTPSLSRGVATLIKDIDPGDSDLMLWQTMMVR
jgi:hypothetical protein